MDFEAMENDIVSHLTSNISKSIATVSPLPENLADYEKPYQKAKVVVMFTGDKADDPQSTNEVSQHRTVTFDISIQSRLLRGSNGIYKVSELVKCALVGHFIPDCGRMYFISHDFARVDQDIWEHTLTFAARTMIVQNYFNDDYPDELDVTLEKVDVDYRDGTENVFPNENS